MSDFALHPRLAADCFDLGSLGLSRLLVLNDSRYPWCVLVPQRPAISELFELSEADQQQLMGETAALGKFLHGYCAADKINVGALGNLVPQLHIHVLARFADDAAWPGPVWGVGEAVPYEDAARQQFCQRLREAFDLPD